MLPPWSSEVRDGPQKCGRTEIRERCGGTDHPLGPALPIPPAYPVPGGVPATVNAPFPLSASVPTMICPGIIPFPLSARRAPAA